MPKGSKPQKDQLDVGGRQITVSNLDKVLYPGSRFTKGQVLDYYIRVADFLLPHFENRPVTLKRFPGVKGEFFYEKDAPSFTPEWIKRYPVPRRAGGPDIQYILINDLPTLVWCANAASLELHPFLHRVPSIEQPTSVVFDLDPGEGSSVLTCAQVAFLLREVMQDLGLECLAKVSGSKGIQVYVPLNTPVTYEITSRLRERWPSCSRNSIRSSSWQRWPKPKGPRRCSSEPECGFQDNSRRLLLESEAEPSPSLASGHMERTG